MEAKWKCYILLPFVLLFSSSLFAATNPTNPSESSSEGSSDISLTIPDLYRVSGIDDMSITYDGGSFADLYDDLCIYTNNATSEYNVRIQGSSTCTGGGDCTSTPSDSFAVSNDSLSYSIGYLVYWNDQASAAGLTYLGAKKGSAVTTSTNQTGASTHTSCTPEGGTNARLRLLFFQIDLAAAPSGTYTGSVTLTLLPPS